MGRLNFATDTWTAENHRAFVVILVFLEQRGKVLVVVLDLVEVPEAHTGMTLARVFVDVLKAFGIADKVSTHLTSLVLAVLTGLP